MCTPGGLSFFIGQVKFSPNILSLVSTDGQIHRGKTQAVSFTDVVQEVTYGMKQKMLEVEVCACLCPPPPVLFYFQGGVADGKQHICSVRINIQLQHLFLYW